MKKTSAAIKKLIVETLDANKAEDIQVLDVKKLTDIADYMVICSGNSVTHNKALANKVITELAKHKIKAISEESDNAHKWVLIDFADIIVHIMLPEVREFYALEKLWSITKPKKSRSKTH